MSNYHSSNAKLTHADQQWNKMWELWVKGKIPSPYAELMRYQSEVYNGGHGQYFCNTANCYDLKAEVEALLPILPPPLDENLRRCHAAFAATGDVPDDEGAELFEVCDNAFYEHEDQINKLLEAYAATIKLPPAQQPSRPRKFGLTAMHLRILALFLMLLDHLWGTVVPGNNWMTYLGRMAFPIFAFQAAEGYRHTHDFRGYCKRLALFAVLSEIPFNLMISGSPIFPFHQNVMLTLLLGLLCCRAFDQRKWWKILLLYLAGALTFPDYGVLGVATVLMFHSFRGNKWLQLGFLILVNWFGYEGQQLLIGTFEVPVQAFAIGAFLPIALYNGEKGPGGKALQYGSYAFYPIHMLILGLL